MKIKNTEPSLTPKKLTKQRRKSKKSRAAKEARKRRRKLKAARNREPSKWRPVETSSQPKPASKAPFVVRQGLSAMSGNWYWLNYYNVFQWKDHHLSKRGVTAYTLPWQNMWPADGRVASIGGAEACGSGLQCTADSCEPVTDTSATTVDDDCDEDYVDKEEVASDVESDEDIVVTEEMMQFLEISMRHKASKSEFFFRIKVPECCFQMPLKIASCHLMKQITKSGTLRWFCREILIFEVFLNRSTHV
uniref:Uncharacterized protein n=1 Tax=Lygus hesperus TaxID=30085 RepID=A0A0A9YFT1_LYGHE